MHIYERKGDFFNFYLTASNKKVSYFSDTLLHGKAYLKVTYVVIIRGLLVTCQLQRISAYLSLKYFQSFILFPNDIIFPPLKMIEAKIQTKIHIDKLHKIHKIELLTSKLKNVNCNFVVKLKNL